MSDLFSVRVESREERSILLRLQIQSPDEVTFPLSPSFAMMLIADESLDSHSELRAWTSAREDEDEFFNPSDHITAVRLIEVRGLPREQGEPPLGLTWDQVDDSEDKGLLGEALYEIHVDVDGMLAHLKPGASWSSTAYDELSDGPLYLGNEGDAREWVKAT
jgi:hypothetical protein